VADAVAQLGKARGLVADQRDEQRGEGDERGGLKLDLDEQQRGQDASAEQPLAVERVDVSRPRAAWRSGAWDGCGPVCWCSPAHLRSRQRSDSSR